MAGQGLTLFYSYSHADEDMRVQLAKHLKLLERQKILQGWSDRDISAGSEWRGQIDQRLESADIVLLLISPDFIASEYCWDVELAAALRRHNAGECAVVPVFLREVDFSGAPFAELQGLPRDARPVTSWPNQDEAFAQIASGLRALARQLADPSEGSAPAADALKPGPSAGQARDVQRIAGYRSLFDRPAFTMPCVFEYSIEEVSKACDQILSAMLTGNLSIGQYGSGTPLTQELPRRDNFETDLFRSALVQVRNYISDLKRTVRHLHIRVTHPPDGAQLKQRSFQDVDYIFDMDLVLVDLISAGATQQFIRDTFSIMDKVDSERNAILELMNGLFRTAGLSELPYIILSSQQLERSRELPAYDWENFYLRNNELILQFLETGDRGRGRGIT